MLARKGGATYMATRYEYGNRQGDNNLLVLVLLIIGIALLFFVFVYPTVNRNNDTNVNIETPVGSEQPTRVEPSPTVMEEEQTPSATSSPTVLPTQ